MRLRLFERVRRLAHPRAGRDRPLRDRAGEAVRHDRAWEAHSRSRPGDARSQAIAPDTAGRHRREGREPAEEAASGHTAGQPGPPWASAPRTGTPDTGARAPSARAPGNGTPRTGTPRGNLDADPAGPAGPAGRENPSSAAELPSAPVGGARARVRRGPYGTAPVAPAAAPPAQAAGRVGRRGQARPPDQPARARQHWYEAERGYLPTPRQPSAGQPAAAPGTGPARPRLPFAHAHQPGRPSIGDGRRNCGALESVLWRQWDPATTPPPEAVLAVDRLAELPQTIKVKLAAGLDGIYVGPGGVPQLDDMTALRGVPLPSGRATWDACAGAYGERKIVAGTRPSPTPDVMCHEVGHALDDLDSPAGKWQSDSAEFRMLYDQCQPHLASDFHRQRGGLGRKEFFADAFAAIASRQRPALVDMLGGDTRTALNVMLYFNRRYGI
jgi:hypothetical protein